MKNYGHKLGVITAMALAAALPERKLTKDFLESEIDKVEYNRFGETNTHCTITTKSGFTFTGESACVDPNNFDQKIGEKFAYEQAFEKMWMPYGFWLHKALAEYDQRMNDDGEPKETAVQATWQDRVCEEIGELVDRKEKLEKFLSGNKPNFVSDAQWDLMKEQLQAMYSYHNILIERLDEDAGVVSGIRLDEQSKSEGLLAVSAVNPTVDSQEYHQQPTMDFGYAVKMMKEGKRVERAGWNGKGMFLYYVPENKYPASRNEHGTMIGVFEDDMVPYGAYIAMKTAQNNVVPWLASQTDVLAEDWQIVE
ncbi:Gp49 family protein [Moraxella osloensis]|uniref:Gp49 family protein n=1 Tax=Faucicola osloensis TaxID=34062 RepID=UPI002005D00E|nr:Gp49 family protein [Moraxella osloensis]